MALERQETVLTPTKPTLSPPKISVIIPLYNVRDYVARAAESITRQAFDGLEVIAVDDGSTDDSLKVCEDHLPYINATYIRQENAGQSAARNAGIQAASGDYVLFLDSDDFLLPGAFDAILPILENEQPDIILGRYLRWSPMRGFAAGKPYNFHPPENPKERLSYILNALPETPWSAVRYICRRAFLLENRLFFKPGVFCEDIPWPLALLENAATISFLPQPFYAYYMYRPLSTLNSRSPRRLLDLNANITEALQQYAGQPAVCRPLIHQSFLYINEYCTFNRRDRQALRKSYQAILPLYQYSDLRLHRMAGKLTHPLPFYWLSVGLCAVKWLRRGWMRARKRAAA